MKQFLLYTFGGFTASLLSFAVAQKNPLSGTYDPISFRLVGPALTSGRIADIAVHPQNKDVWYIAAASGGVWKTVNHGTTFEPIFDNYGSYSTACVKIDPNNPNIIWVGSGENNNQRSAAYGDGVYKSVDGGKSFSVMGLKNSEHIGNIVIHPKESNTIWVAAYGPLWSSGGERGVYKSTDGGKSWNRTLFVSDHTGISDLVMDPNNPDVLYASAHQRQRKEWTYIGGGPESAVYKSTDGGITWKTIHKGLPEAEMGRIGLAISPVQKGLLYAIVEAKYDKGGFYRSTDHGETWSKMSSWNTSGNYYQEIICDPQDAHKVFSMDTYLHHTTDGGKNFERTGEEDKHVDNHCIWIDPSNTDHWLVGCDGGLYETFDHAKTWKYFDNLPLIQFYKVATDNSEPFYNIYGGTQDNNSMGGPAASINNAGILNSDWFITNGGDGFESAIDPTDPNIVYAQAQYGWIVRYDRKSGEKVPIQPMPEPGQPAYRWNWDAPLLISPHDHKTLYFASNKVLKSTNRGDDWQEISPDLSSNIDRNKLKVMGQVWSVDAVMKNASTTIYGNIVALDESPLVKGLLYAGTDDGLVYVSEDDGKNWRKISAIAGVPAQTRVNMLTASSVNPNEVFAVFNNHRSGDFKPYVFRSGDRGKSWSSVVGNLPVRGSAYCLKQAHQSDKLLFVGTDFGCYFSNDNGVNWNKLNGLPTIAVMDLDIQKRENDLVAATFGRGFYVLDDYTPLLQLSDENLKKPAYLFPTKDALLYVPSSPLGNSGKSSQGSDLWVGENPAYGAVFHLHLNREFESLKNKRKTAEKKAEKDKLDVFYPTIEELRKEEMELSPKLVWIIRDAQGKEVKRMSSAPKKGTQRVNWRLRTESMNTVSLNQSSKSPYYNGDDGFLVAPGTYTVEVFLLSENGEERLVEPQSFKVVGLNNQSLVTTYSASYQNFKNDLSELSRQAETLNERLKETKKTMEYLKRAVTDYPKTELKWYTELVRLDRQLDSLNTVLNGDRILSSREFETAPSVMDRLGITEYQLYANTTEVTATHRKNLAYLEKEISRIQQVMDGVVGKVNTIQKKMQDAKVPYIPHTNGQ